MSSSISDEGFVQDYELNTKQELWLYCRLCRNAFPVVFKPRHRKVKLKCVCGHEGTLDTMDVFSEEDEAREHAAFYEKVYRAAKSALADAGIPIPPSGKYAKVEDIHQDSGFESYFDVLSDQSAIQDGYFEESESGVTPSSITAHLAEFDNRLAATADDVYAQHQVLSEIVTWTYCRRHMNPMAEQRFYEACKRDILLAEQVIQEVKARLRRGEKARLSFSSFKHLLIALEDDAEYEEALEVAEQAADLGLKGYAEKAARLREQLRRSDPDARR